MRRRALSPHLYRKSEKQKKSIAGKTTIQAIFSPENKCVSCVSCCWALFESFFPLLYVTLDQIKGSALWSVCRCAALAIRGIVSLETFFFFFWNEAVSQLFMIVIASKLVAPHSVISNWTSSGGWGVCLCMCVCGRFFPSFSQFGFRSSVDFKVKVTLMLLSSKVWWCKVIGRAWGEAGACVPSWCVSCYLQTKVCSNLMPCCCVLRFQGKARSERAERKVSTVLILHGTLGLLGGNNEGMRSDLFFFCFPSQTPSLSVTSESVPFFGSTCFKISFSNSRWNAETHMNLSTMAKVCLARYRGRLAHSSQVVNTSSASPGEWVTPGEVTAAHSHSFHLSSLLYLISTVLVRPR